MVELVGNIPDDVVLQARLDILYGQTPDITIKAHELPEESEPTVEKSGTLAEPVFDIGIPQAMGAVAAREYAKQAEAARDAAILAGENAKEELNGIVASADAALDQKITETGTALDEKVATATQRASEAASSAAAAAQKATAAEQAMQGAQAAQVQAEQSAQEAAENTAMAKDFASGQPVTYSGTPVSIAYAGANRIDALTLYGENVQGGTTEAPVALTGVDSVFVGGNNLFSAKLVADKFVDVNRFTSYDKSNYYSTDTPIPVMKNTTYRLSSSGVLFRGNLHFKNKKGKTLSQIFNFYTFTVPNDADYIMFTVLEERVTDPNAPIMLNVGTEPLPYEPYQGSVTQLPIQRPLRRVGDVRDVCVTRQEYEGTEKLVVTYNVGFVELDGTEYMTLGNIDASQKVQQFNISNVLSSPKGTDAICSHISSASSVNEESISIYDNRLLVAVWLRDPLLEYGFVAGDSGTYIHAFKAYLAAQKAAGTPVQIAYQLATPETYATDPLDFDNAAGPLTVMTGGEVEVRMTELVGSRSPELTHKLDKTGDGSNVTAAFTEAEQDADIASGEKLSVLFGKIKKRFSVVNKLVNGAVYPNLGTNTNFPNPVNQRGATSYTGDGTSPYCIDRWRISNGTTYTVGTFTLSAATYANRACGMWQTNEMGAHQLSIGDDVTVSIYANGKLYTPTMKVIDRGLYDAFTNVPAGYDCDDFEIVLCTYAGNNTVYNLGIYPKKPLTVNYIKWEKGSVATPYVPKDYGAELAECLRYFQRVHADWRIYPTLKDMLYRFSQSTLQVMRIKPTISAHGTPYTFGCTINALDAQPMAFTVETKITEQGQNAAAASMLGYFDLSADL